jgi:hypothetical protein
MYTAYLNLVPPERPVYGGCPRQAHPVLPIMGKFHILKKYMPVDLNKKNP